jgi:hypothetical protein
MLPEVEKYIIIMISLFPSGMKLDYIIDIIKRSLIIDSKNEILDNINTLRILGYIIVNSSSGDLVKPAHEKIITSIKKLLNNDDYLEIYNNLLLNIEEIISSKAMSKNELYLLNCLIGLFTANQLQEKIGYVIRAITINYQQCLYNYIDLLYPDIREVLTILPNDCIIKILDSFQKTSNFYNGLEMITILKNTLGLTIEYNLFYAKFLTQTYQFYEALAVLEEMNHTDSVILYKMNIYQHLYNDAKAKHLLSILVQNNKDVNSLSDEYYIALRNTAHYFSYEEAVLNLNRVNDFFRRKGFLFGEATANNNLGVIYLWAYELDKAKRLLLRANNIFEKIGSNELFESQINLGVLAYLESDYKAAIKHMENAEMHVPKSLWMDVLIIHVNKILCLIAARMITVDIAFDELCELYPKIGGCQDPWVKFQVLYNTAAIAKLADKIPPEDPDENIERSLKSKEFTRFDILALLTYDDTPVNISLSMSPNWRY